MEGSERYRDRQGDTGGGDSLLNTVNPIIVTLFFVCEFHTLI